MMPPGIRTGETPPFHKLNEYVFQELCRDLLDAEPDITICEVYGVRGQSQDGIDLLAHRTAGDGIEVGQCKCCEDFPPREIRKASDEFLAHWNRWSKENVKRFVLFVASDLDTRQRQDEILKQRSRFADFGITYEAWSAAKIRNKLRPHLDIVSTYCQPADHWTRVICGVASPVSLPTREQAAQTRVNVQTALLSQLDQLAARMSSEIEQRLKSMRTAYREGRGDEAIMWLKDLKSDATVWPFLAPEVKAELLGFEAGLELDMTGNFSRAKQLADEAQTLVPSDSQTRLRALIAYWETGPEAAIELLEGHQDIDSLNLKAAFLLEMGRVDESLGILNLEESGPEADGET